MGPAYHDNCWNENYLDRISLIYETNNCKWGLLIMITAGMRIIWIVLT